MVSRLGADSFGESFPELIGIRYNRQASGQIISGQGIFIVIVEITGGRDVFSPEIIIAYIAAYYGFLTFLLSVVESCVREIAIYNQVTRYFRCCLILVVGVNYRCVKTIGRNGSLMVGRISVIPFEPACTGIIRSNRSGLSVGRIDILGVDRLNRIRCIVEVGVLRISCFQEAGRSVQAGLSVGEQTGQAEDMRRARIDIIHMMLTFGIRHGDTQGSAIRIFERHNTVQNVRAVMRIDIRSDNAEVRYLTRRRTVFGDGNLNETLLGMIRGGKEIIGMTIIGTYRLVQSVCAVKTPFIIGILNLHPFAAVPFEPGTSLIVVVPRGRTDKTGL